MEGAGGAIREGRWLCPSCGAENLGRAESCATCGAARPAGVRFFLPGDARAVTEAALIRDALSGADWTCSHCGGANPGSVEGRRLERCGHCGQARDEADAATPVRTFAPGEAPATAAAAQAAEREAARGASRERRAARIEAEAASLGGRRGLAAGRPLRAAALAALALLAILAVAAWAWPRAHEGRVAELAWTRTVAVERLVTRVEAGWAVPPGGRPLGSERRIRSYRDVVDHYETRTRQVSFSVPDGSESYDCGSVDLGNGYFQDRTCTRTTYRTEYRTESYQAPVFRQEPVWDTWRTWEEDRWEVVRTDRAEGGDTVPAWPEVRLGEREREGERHEVLTAVLEDAEGRVGLELAPEAWSALDEGDAVRWREGPLTGVALDGTP